MGRRGGCERSRASALAGAYDFRSDLFPGYAAHAGQGASSFRFHRARTYVFRRSMDCVYTTFKSELQAWHEEATSAGETSLVSAVQAQLTELQQTAQSRMPE
jgi:hypothetical protein